MNRKGKAESEEGKESRYEAGGGRYIGEGPGRSLFKGVGGVKAKPVLEERGVLGCRLRRGWRNW